MARPEPGAVLITTPNVEYNALFAGLPTGELRHRDHRFEWTRQQFQEWARRCWRNGTATMSASRTSARTMWTTARRPRWECLPDEYRSPGAVPDCPGGAFWVRQVRFRLQAFQTPPRSCPPMPAGRWLRTTPTTRPRRRTHLRCSISSPPRGCAPDA